jgi:hypothetical protein
MATISDQTDVAEHLLPETGPALDATKIASKDGAGAILHRCARANETHPDTAGTVGPT